MSESVYEKNGYIDRDDYLETMGKEYDVEFSYVRSLSKLLGANEDFDGLVNALEDMG